MWTLIQWVQRQATNNQRERSRQIAKYFAMSRAFASFALSCLCQCKNVGIYFLLQHPAMSPFSPFFPSVTFQVEWMKKQEKRGEGESKSAKGVSRGNPRDWLNNNSRNQLHRNQSCWHQHTPIHTHTHTHTFTHTNIKQGYIETSVRWVNNERNVFLSLADTDGDRRTRWATGK